MTSRERAELDRAEKRLSGAPDILSEQFAVGLSIIRRDELWRAGPYRSFWDYCRERWGLETKGVSRVLGRYKLD